MTLGGNNLRGSGSGGGISYTTSEQDTGLTWHDGSSIYQKTVNFGALPNSTSKSVAHGITGLDIVISVEGWFKDSAPEYVPIVFNASSSANDIGTYLDATNIIIITAKNRSGASGYVTI